jgi:hypothetical protein
MPHFHVSGLHATIVFLFIVAAFGSLHLAACSKPDALLSQGWLALGF